MAEMQHCITRDWRLQGCIDNWYVTLWCIKQSLYAKIELFLNGAKYFCNFKVIVKVTLKSTACTTTITIIQSKYYRSWPISMQVGKLISLSIFYCGQYKKQIRQSQKVVFSPLQDKLICADSCRMCLLLGLLVLGACCGACWFSGLVAGLVGSRGLLRGLLVLGACCGACWFSGLVAGLVGSRGLLRGLLVLGACCRACWFSGLVAGLVAGLVGSRGLLQGLLVLGACCRACWFSGLVVGLVGSRPAGSPSTFSSTFISSSISQ